ncbi:MAG: hypothetical protein HC772_14645 [Leptolyngbyaceae cyanobacterium CRU_2_3]|nr:hypothetical protein [Leptolyngbyaceae cyanobacterium CRU_2_3]
MGYTCRRSLLFVTSFWVLEITVPMLTVLAEKRSLARVFRKLLPVWQYRGERRSCLWLWLN